MQKESKNMKLRHSSLDMPDVEVVKKKQDMLTKARNKLFGDKNKDVLDSTSKKPGKYSTIEYLFKATHKPTGKLDQVKLQKQNSISSYPIEIQVDEYDDCSISRHRPATICTDKIDQNLRTAALALERPRKKLSFKEPDTISPEKLKRDGTCVKGENSLKIPMSGMKRSISFTDGIIRTPSVDYSDLENQAMRIVRTVGQAFEVCHKLSITGPENENLDQEEQETLTQDLMSDRLSDTASERYRKDRPSESDMERLSFLGCDDSIMKETQGTKNSRLATPRQLEVLPPPPCSNNISSSMISSETYSSPHSDMLKTENGATNSLPPPGTPLSVHHEIQLLREQLEQQNQQTQATAAQLQLAREQLIAEQAARMEAQSRTRQLLVHNRELLDHIAALVSHLQNGSDKSGAVGNQQQNPSYGTLPQHQGSVVMENFMSDLPETLDNTSHPVLGQNPHGFIENRAVTSCLPPSPHQTFNPAGNIFNYPYPQEASFENQLLQRLQCLSGYTTPTPYPFNFTPGLPYFQPPYYPNMLNSHFPNFPTSSPLTARHSFADNDNIQGIRHSSEPRQLHQYNTHPRKPLTSFNLPNHNDLSQNPSIPQSHNTTSSNLNTRNSPLRATTPRPSSLIKPLSQIGTLTTTDSGGNVRVIVPVPNTTSNSISNEDDKEGLLANLKLTDDFRMNGSPIQRTTSEKVPNRSELMSQVQRAMWTRHTTK